jgi:hypothetical protein
MGGAGASAGSGGGQPPTVSVVSQGPDSLVDLLVSARGVFVVTSSELLLYDGTDSLVFQQSFPREVTAAAMDGDVVAVADRALVTPFFALQAQAPMLLTEACQSAAIVSGHRFICSPFDYVNRILRTYNLDTGVQIAQSAAFTYIGAPIRRIPGRDALISTDYSVESPSDFYLFDVGADGKVVYVNDSPYHGDFPVTFTFAFDGVLAAHVIQETGLLLAIYGLPGTPCTSDAPSGCFLEDGALGTLKGNEHFVALTEGASGTVLGLVAANTDAPGCGGGCGLHMIDIATRSAATLGSYQPMGAADRLIARAAPAPGRVLYVAYDVTAPGTGYRVEAIRY